MAESNNNNGGSNLIARLQAMSQEAGKRTAQDKLASLTDRYSSASARSVSRHSKRMRRGGHADLKNLPAAIEAQRKMIAEGSYKTDARMNEVIKGAQFGQEVLGEEGLGRIGTDTEVKETLGRFKDISEKGLSRAEMAAERAQTTRDIDSATQTGMRGLQAKLARMGVKGAVAGQQLIGREMQGAQQKADLAQNLFLKSEQVKREGLKDYSQRLGEVKSFDLGQAAKEKDILLQSGLGFAQMGSSEATAKYAADQSRLASIAAAKASKPSGGSTVVCTELHRQGLIPTEVWHKNVRFGMDLNIKFPHVFNGYLLWGKPVANLMKKSKLATFVLAPVMKQWINYIGGNKTMVNTFVFTSLLKICEVLGNIFYVKEKKQCPVITKNY